MADSLAGEARTAEQDAVGPGRVELRELVEGDDLAAVGENASTSRLGDTERAELDALRGVEHADIVSHGADDDGHLALLAPHELGELREGERRPVHARHEQTLEDDSVELGLGAASEEAVKLENRGERRQS